MKRQLPGQYKVFAPFLPCWGAGGEPHFTCSHLWLVQVSLRNALNFHKSTWSESKKREGFNALLKSGLKRKICYFSNPVSWLRKIIFFSQLFLARCSMLSMWARDREPASQTRCESKTGSIPHPRAVPPESPAPATAISSQQTHSFSSSGHDSALSALKLFICWECFFP